MGPETIDNHLEKDEFRSMSSFNTKPTVWFRIGFHSYFGNQYSVSPFRSYWCRYKGIGTIQKANSSLAVTARISLSDHSEFGSSERRLYGNVFRPVLSPRFETCNQDLVPNLVIWKSKPKNWLVRRTG